MCRKKAGFLRSSICKRQSCVKYGGIRQHYCTTGRERCQGEVFAQIENITQNLYSSCGTNPKSVFLRDASKGGAARKLAHIYHHSEDRTMLEKLRDAIHELVQKLTGKTKKQAQTAERMLQEAFEAASRRAAENSKKRRQRGRRSEVLYQDAG